MIKIYEPYLTDDTLHYAFDALKSKWISSQGEYIGKATESLCEFVNTKNCTLVGNGTVATHSIFHLMNLRFPFVKNIVVPNNVYVAAWNSILLEKKDYNLVSVDCNLETWNYDLDELYECLKGMNTQETALFVVHNLGSIINVPKIKRDFPHLIIIEDNCEGFTGFYEGKPTGTESFASSVSFFANKNFTSGEGGAVITNSQEDSEYIKRFINQGNTHRRFVHDIVAQNYRITNIHASLLFGQFQKSEEILKLKKSIFDLYYHYLSNNDNIIFQKSEENTQRSNWMFGIILKHGTYEELSKFLLKNNVETRPMFFCYEEHEHLKNRINPYRSNKNAIELNKRAIVLPSSPTITEEQIKYISDLLLSYTQGVKNGN